MKRFIVAGLAILLFSSQAFAATAYSANACGPKPTQGDPASQNIWGNLLNTGTNIWDGLTSAVASISVAGSSNVVLTFTCGSLDQTDAAHFTFTGALTGNIYVLWPNARGRMFSVTNSTTGSFTLSLAANSGGSPAGAYVAIAQGSTGIFYSDGTNVYPRTTAGGVSVAANSVVGNMTGATAQGASLPVPDCSGALTFASGAGFGCGSGGGGGGGGLTFGGTQSANFTAAANILYCIDTSAGVVQMTLPATPTTGTQVGWVDCNSSFATYTFTVANNGNNLMGFNANMTVTLANAGATLVYSGATLGWRMY